MASGPGLRGTSSSVRGKEDAAFGQRVLGSLTQVVVPSGFSLDLVELSGMARVKMSTTVKLQV